MMSGRGRQPTFDERPPLPSQADDERIPHKRALRGEEGRALDLADITHAAEAVRFHNASTSSQFEENSISALYSSYNREAESPELSLETILWSGENI
jgi:hypothetical protein